MRAPVDHPRLLEFLRALGHASRHPGRLYLTGGASAVLVGWRTSTIAIDITLSASLQPLLKEIPALKERLSINVELASPSDFIPELPGWEDLSMFVVREGAIDVFHYDFHSQALSKLERGHAKDLDDVAAMRREGLVDPVRCSHCWPASSPSCTGTLPSTHARFGARWSGSSDRPDRVDPIA